MITRYSSPRIVRLPGRPWWARWVLAYSECVASAESTGMGYAITVSFAAWTPVRGLRREWAF